uniref:UDP-glycosyltransferases domain-containing protein n=1 Tax=Leersia perrieri TaxID=77586 RepID=A0A0D9WXN7_9ORYZ
MARQEQAADVGAGRRRIVLFALPYQGHLGPMFLLAALLLDRGLAVTVLHTDFNAPDPACHPPDITFIPIHKSAASSCSRPPARRRSTRPWCRCGKTGRTSHAWCLMRSVSATASRNILAFPGIRNTGYFPMRDERRDETAPGLEPLRVRDLIREEWLDENRMCIFMAQPADAMRSPMSGVIINTFDAIEAAELDKLQAELSLLAFAVGPLHKLSTATAAAKDAFTLRAPHRGCLVWLHAQPPWSVLYVSLGSMAMVTRAMFDEIAWGLSASSVPFLWVVRPGSINGAAGEVDTAAVQPLPDGVDMSRGMVVPWAPRREVLAHPATGGFGTHCGRNSTLESICEGVPMLAQPCFGDQMVNVRYVTHQWAVGMELSEVFDHARVAEAVREL